MLYGQIRFLCDVPEIRNRKTFKMLDPSRQLYEFRTRAGLRLYCFLHGNQLVLLANGGKKNTKKEQTRDIEHAKQLQDEFLALKDAGAKLILIEP